MAVPRHWPLYENGIYMNEAAVILLLPGIFTGYWYHVYMINTHTDDIVIYNSLVGGW